MENINRKFTIKGVKKALQDRLFETLINRILTIE